MIREEAEGTSVMTQQSNLYVKAYVHSYILEVA